MMQSTVLMESSTSHPEFLLVEITTIWSKHILMFLLSDHFSLKLADVYFLFSLGEI